MIAVYQPDIIVIEDVFFYSMVHAGTAICLARLSAIPYLVAGTIPVYRINPSSWKARVLGSGKATKEDSIAYVLAVYGKVVEDDEADAICVGLAWYYANDKLVTE